MDVRRESGFTWRGLAIDTSNPDVYPPKPASLLLAEVATNIIQPGARILDACTGSGIVGIALAKSVSRVSVAATDISPICIASAWINAERNGVQLDLKIGDLYAPFSQEPFDAIVVHPPAVPYIPGADWGLSNGMHIATNGGIDGSSMVLRAIREARSCLRDGGTFLLLLPHWSNYRKTHTALVHEFHSFDQLAERQVDFFPMIEGTPSAAMLEHVTGLAKSGVIELDFSGDVPRSRVSVVRAIKHCRTPKKRR